MRTIATAATLALLIAVLGLAVPAQAQTTVTVDPAALTLGYMNVFELPVNGGAFVFGSTWGLPDLTAVFSGSNLTLGPNTINDPDPFWYIGGGAPGSPGNKIMEANCYAEDTGTLNGQTVTFNGMVLANSLTSAHTVIAFVKDFAPDYSSFNQNTVVLSATGPFSVSLATINDPGRHVQWGVQMTGVNVWPTDVGPFGTMTLGPQAVPTEATTWGRLKSLFD